MLFATTADDAARTRNRVRVNGEDYVLSGYIGRAPTRGMYVEGNEANDNRLPQGFLVEQPPHSVTPPHFHEVDQFQVFVSGSGRMGKHWATPISVHYAGGHTPYGPIVAGPEGVRYFTLRRAWDPGAKYMPQSRDRLRAVKREFRMSRRASLSSPAVLATAPAATEEVVLAPEESGLCAWLHRAGPGATVAAGHPGVGGGQYVLVVAGSLVLDKDRYGPLSCLFQTAEEQKLTGHAGDGGVELLIMRFPANRG